MVIYRCGTYNLSGRPTMTFGVGGGTMRKADALRFPAPRLCGPHLSGDQAARRSYHREIEMESYEESVKSFQASIREWQNKHDKNLEEFARGYQTGLRRCHLSAIDRHAREGRNFSQLIYDRLGFNYRWSIRRAVMRRGFGVK